MIGIRVSQITTWTKNKTKYHY